MTAPRRHPQLPAWRAERRSLPPAPARRRRLRLRAKSAGRRTAPPATTRRRRPLPRAAMSWAARLTAGDTRAVRPFAFSEFNWGRRSGHWYYTPSRTIRGTRYKLIRGYRQIPIYVGFRLACALRGRPRDGGALVRRASARHPAVRPAGRIRSNCATWPATPPWPPSKRTSTSASTASCAPPATRFCTAPWPNRADEPDVPQWHRQPDGSFRLVTEDPADPGEVSFT